MKIKEEKKSLRKKEIRELYKELTKARNSVAKFKKDLAFGKLKSPQKLVREKRKVAFILTIIHQKMEKNLEKDEQKT